MQTLHLSDQMAGKTVLLTGAGGGIGYEAARAFASMGAKIIIAEIQSEKGKWAEEQINAAFQSRPACFYQIDLSDEAQIRTMAEWIIREYECPDIVFNNAAITKMGAVDQVETTFWDNSYAVNLKAPLVLTQIFLPLMKERGSGTVVFVSSSGAAPFMGAYEVFKTAQVELSSTLAMELENTGVFTYTIGPGLVKTETARNSIEIVAKNMGLSTEDFYAMNDQHILEAEKAGLGFALSAAFAQRYHGQEIGCIQVLADFNLPPEDEPDTGSSSAPALSDFMIKQAEERFAAIQNTFQEQYAGWKKMNLFERQWVFRDFKKYVGLSAEQAGEILRQIQNKLKDQLPPDQKQGSFIKKLGEYWQHQLQLLRGYEKNKDKLEQNTQIINGWIRDIEHFKAYFWPDNPS